MKRRVEMLKELRKKVKKTPEDAAKHLGISVSSYTKYENSDRVPSLEIVLKMPSFYDCSFDKLMGVLALQKEIYDIRVKKAKKRSAKSNGK